MAELEKEFHRQMLNIHAVAQKELNYNATRFSQLVSTIGGVKAAKQLISKEGGTYGFEILWENKRLDLSVEALVLNQNYKDLFSDNEITLCQERLKNFGYSVE